MAPRKRIRLFYCADAAGGFDADQGSCAIKSVRIFTSVYCYKEQYRN